jgi:long-chain acyl-CoA synthetase
MRETLLSFLDTCLARGNETAVVHWRGLRASSCSFARLAGLAFQFARELEARRIGHGDRVLFWSENSPEWIGAFFGCLLRGAVVVPLDLKSTADFVTLVQQQVSAKLVLTDQPQAVLNVPRLSLSNLAATVAGHSEQPYRAGEIKPHDLVQIIFTSGTTAEPKGVCLTHRNLLANLTPIEKEFAKYARWERLVHPLRFLCLLPLSHVFGQLMGIFIPQILGAEVYFRESYKPAEIIEAVKGQRINVIVTVPRVLETLRDKLEHDYGARAQRETLASQIAAAEGRHFVRNWWNFREIHHRFGWRFWAFVTGGATLEADTETFWRRLGFAVIQGYGMTETASLASLSHPFRIARGSIGKPVAGQELKLNESGEILVRGDNVSPGYWNRGVRPMTDEEGWIHTGDLGEVGAEGNVYFRGRSKDTIVTAAGMKIFPGDLEAALDHQPEIKASAVVPFAGPKGTAALAALIPSSEDSDLNAAVNRANESLAEFQHIRHWISWPQSDFPRTNATRKVIKGLVAETANKILSEKEGLRTPPLHGEQRTTASAILPVISEIAGVNAEGLDSSAKLADELKLDSLGRVELLSALEDRYQIELDEAAFTGATTIGELDQMVRKGKAESVAYPYPTWTMRFPMTWIRMAVYHVLLLPITFIMCRVRVRGIERLSSVKSPALLISNHITDVDAALIMSALPAPWRARLATAMDGERLRNYRYPPASTPWFSRLNLKLQYALLVALFNVFSLPKQSGFRRSFSYAGQAMDRGWSILVFPEGQETKDGRMQPFMAGIGLLTAELNTSVIPIKLEGLFELKQRRQFFVRPGTVTVTFGEPLEFSGETPTQITRALESRLASL